jgi:hypothetical protein
MPSYSRRVQIPGKSSQELYDKVSQDIERFLSKASLGKFDVERDDGRKELRVKSSMFSATLACREAEMELNAQLSLLATPFKSKLDDAITRWIAKTFNLNSVS